jgi:hypothetical protein
MAITVYAGFILGYFNEAREKHERLIEPIVFLAYEMEKSQNILIGVKLFLQN